MTLANDERTRWFLRHILPHEPALRGWLRRKRTPDLDVDDIVQETYAVLATRERVDDIRHPRAYLFQVAHSLIVQHIRRARIVSIQAVDDLDQFIPVDEGASPEQSAVDRDELMRLAEAIATLPGKTREAFVLRRVHCLPQREIALRMRISENTVEKHIARGIRLLAERFGRGGKPASQTSRKTGQESRFADGRARDKSGH